MKLLREGWAILQSLEDPRAPRTGRKGASKETAKSAGVKGSARRGEAVRRRVRHVVCVSNDGFEASLERFKIYLALSDRDARREGRIRVIDESGEAFLYPRSWFAAIEVSPDLAKAIAANR